jgi:hypothetical protein
MFNLSRKEIFTGLIVTVVGGLILIFLNERIKKSFPPEKVEVTKLPPLTDTLPVKIVNLSENEPGMGQKPGIGNPIDTKDSLFNTEKLPIKGLDNNVAETRSVVSENLFVADYLISGASSNQMEDILDDIQTMIEKEGHTAVLNSKNESTSFQALKSRYNKLVLVTVKLTFSSLPNTTDSRTVSTSYSYSIKSYDVHSGRVVAAITDSNVQPGFSKEETISQIRKSIISSLKDKL